MPFAYGLREHAVTRWPAPLDLAARACWRTPRAWRAHVAQAHVEILPLAERERQPGWFTASANLTSSPEVEVISGAINSKHPDHAVIWRQGNLLHFGLREGPAELNDNGRRLLANCIDYVARFREDRPIARTPTLFREPRLPRWSRWLLDAAARADARPGSLLQFFDATTRRALAGASIRELREWIDAQRRYLLPVAGGALAVDEDARALGAEPAAAAFPVAARHGLTVASQRDRWLRLLARVVPDGPGASTGDRWLAWLGECADYLFFDESAGYVWQVDPLARRRRVPTRSLRGAARAD